MNDVIEELVGIIFNEPPAIGLSALVSLLASQLSTDPVPRARSEAVVTILRTLVEMNVNREEALSIYIL